MEKLRNRYLIVALLMLATSGMVSAVGYEPFYEAGAGIRAVESIPLEIGKWHGKNLPLQENVYQILETKSILHRTYNNKGSQVFLSVVHYPKTKVDFHAPEACLSAQGIEIQKIVKNIHVSHETKVVKIKLNQLIWQREDRRRLVYYFYKAGDFIGESYIKLRFNLAINKFANTEKSGSLIRISTPIPSGDIQKAADILSEFTGDLYPFILRFL